MPGKVLPVVSFGFKIILRSPYEKLRGTRLHSRLPWRPRTLISTDRFTLQQIVENFQKLDFVTVPFKVDCPVHFSGGRLDPVALYFYIKRMHQALPNSTLRVFEMGGHNFMDQRSDEFNDWLLEHLNGKTNSFT
jgi:pimeloyl-ACP methyl ester carboxylesterase